jgi:hypothetical protein
MRRSATKPMRKYRWSLKSVLSNLAVSLFALPPLVVTATLLALFRSGTPHSPTPSYPTDTSFTAFLALSVACFASFFLLFLLIPVSQILTSYIAVSEDGIEMRSWFTHGLRCTWAQVDRFGSYRSLGLMRIDALFLKEAEPLGPQITFALRKALGLPSPLIIGLSGFSGWPNGGLAQDLRKHLPLLIPPSRSAADQPEIHGGGLTIH